MKMMFKACAGILFVFISSRVLAQGAAVQEGVRQFESQTGMIVTGSVVEALTRPRWYHYCRRGEDCRPRYHQRTADDVFSMLEHYPVLHIVVTPIPPRDYRIYINGVRQLVTEQSEYVVRYGTIDVTVQRVGIPACTWSKEVEDDEEIDCVLSRD
jgi:hypothetical protein